MSNQDIQKVICALVKSNPYDYEQWINTSIAAVCIKASIERMRDEENQRVFDMLEDLIKGNCHGQTIVE